MPRARHPMRRTQQKLFQCRVGSAEEVQANETTYETVTCLACHLDFGAHRTAEALPPGRTFMRPNRSRDRSHPQRRHRQEEPPGPIAAQGCDRQAAGAKACRKACAPQDSKNLALKASAPEHLRPA